jgi:hypothetical protein
VIDVDADPLAAKMADIVCMNTMACNLLLASGYADGSVFQKTLRIHDIAKKEAALTLPYSKEQQEALLKASSHGQQQFKITSGAHVTSDDFFISHQLGLLLKEIATLKSEKRARLDATAHEAAALVVLNHVPNPKDLKVGDLDVLLKWKIPSIALSKIGNKNVKYNKWMSVKDNTTATLEPWTEEDEMKLEEMEKENINIKDTELGRERKQKHNELIAAAPSMSLSTKAKLMNVMNVRETSSE